MYNEQIEQLISAALADGVLTEKEKQILFKKAQSMGIDLDEFEMVLDARLVELAKAEKAKADASAPKSNKLGDVKKCPACGAIVQSYQGVCPECGFAFEGIDANSAVKELSNLLQKTTDHDKMEKIIDNYPIPMEKAALLAFVTWLRPQSTDSKNPLANAYLKKYSECVNKIRVSFANDKDLLPFLSYYDNDAKKVRNQKIVRFTLKNKWFWAGVAVLIILILILKPKPLNKNPEKTNAAMIEAIENGDLEKAEQLYLNFKKSKSYISYGCEALGEAYIKSDQLDKAKKYAGKETLFNAFLKRKMYDEADEYVHGLANNDKLEIVIKTMCENGDKDIAKRYLKSKQSRLKDDMESWYGHTEGTKKYNERIKQLNTLISSY